MRVHSWSSPAKLALIRVLPLPVTKGVAKTVREAMRQVIVGLAGRIDLNGRTCDLLGPAARQPERSRVCVLDTREHVDLKTENLMPEEEYMAMREAERREGEAREEARKAAREEAERREAAAREEARMHANWRFDCRHGLPPSSLEEQEWREREEEYERGLDQDHWSEVLLMRRKPPTYSLDMLMARYPGFDPTDWWGGLVDDDGAPAGFVHPWYDYGRMPGHVGWWMLKRNRRFRAVVRMSLGLRIWHDEVFQKRWVPGGVYEREASARFQGYCEAGKR